MVPLIRVEYASAIIDLVILWAQIRLSWILLE